MKADAECAASTATAGTFQEDIITSALQRFPLDVEKGTGPQVASLAPDFLLTFGEKCPSLTKKHEK